MEPSRFRLFMTPRSPFARRVRLALARLGVKYESVACDVFHPTEEFLRANPLGLIPVLETPQGVPLPDSASILEYLDERSEGGIWPAEPAARTRERMRSTWAEGVMISTVAHYLETLRRAPDAGWLAEHLETIERALGRLEADVTLPDSPTQSVWDTGVCLEYLELRIPSFPWGERYPGFSPILHRCRADAVFRETAPPPA